ncbi:Hypothetical Protein FCC1311_030562 [Hondaea fermentalgiana]|uniref:Uncharacterized protein n=1 Tax=Hondaea fermentalgiana TaxID=2315210 RepID=A0A2R5GG59_9STRA|nr:Hypothetical Protein FCC1311_030562 [Hondaea fermentalgiana]|eukprot:GBG26834.1 Hypothetical Protein FCC1311_030562 [Hondaea fermentalgiana]
MPRSPRKRVRALKVEPATASAKLVKEEDIAKSAQHQGLKRPRPRCEGCLVKSAGEGTWNVRTETPSPALPTMLGEKIRAINVMPGRQERAVHNTPFMHDLPIVHDTPFVHDTPCIDCCKAVKSEMKSAAAGKKGSSVSQANSRAAATTDVECRFHDKVDALLLGWIEGYQERATLRSDPTRLPRGQHVDKLFEHEGDTACLFSVKDLLASTAYKRWKPATISQSRMSKWHIETQFRRHDTESRAQRFKRVLKRIQTQHGISESDPGADVADTIAAANASNNAP